MSNNIITFKSKRAAQNGETLKRVMEIEVPPLTVTLEFARALTHKEAEAIAKAVCTIKFTARDQNPIRFDIPE